jgi:hypothetical protein
MRDELEPPGEQLELPWEGVPLEAVIVEKVVHRITWGNRIWGCTCGAGYTWPHHARPASGQPRAGAVRHMRAVRARIANGP